MTPQFLGRLLIVTCVTCVTGATVVPAAHAQGRERGRAAATPSSIVSDGSARRFLAENPGDRLRAALAAWDALEEDRAAAALDAAAAAIRSIVARVPRADEERLGVDALASAGEDIAALADELDVGRGASGDVLAAQLVDPLLVIARFDLALARLLWASDDRLGTADALGDGAASLQAATEAIGGAAALIAEPYVDDAFEAEAALLEGDIDAKRVEAHFDRLDDAIAHTRALHEGTLDIAGGQR